MTTHAPTPTLTTDPAARPNTSFMLVGAAVGAFIGASLGYALAKKSRETPRLSTGQAIKAGMLLLGTVRQLVSLLEET